MPSDAPVELEVGGPAPDFAALDDQEVRHRLSDYGGRTLVLYFYPKDDTPGCTQEACDFRDRYPRYKKRDIAVLGVSPDDARSHKRFKEKHRLPFPLLVDADKSLCRAYGVWKEKSMYGRKYMGVERSTFVIGPDGKFKAIYRKVSVPGHIEDVLSAAS